MEHFAMDLPAWGRLKLVFNFAKKKTKEQVKAVNSVEDLYDSLKY